MNWYMSPSAFPRMKGSGHGDKYHLSRSRILPRPLSAEYLTALSSAHQIGDKSTPM